MTWIALTLSAVLCQTLRNSFAKQLSAQLSNLSISFCRFLFGLPISAIAFFSAHYLLGAVTRVSPTFYIAIFVFSVAQILATVLLIALFRYKNFAVAVTYSKTEGVFAALLASGMLAEHLSFTAWLGVVIAFVGLLLASFAQKKVGVKNLKASFAEKSTWLGLLCGLLFALASVAVKFSYAYVEADNSLLIPCFALLVAQLMQVFLLLPYLLYKKKYELLHMAKHIRLPLAVGFFSGLGSFFWFLAFSLAYVGYVKTLGQIEFLLSGAMAIYYFKERVVRNELIGIGLIVLGSLLLLNS